MMVKNTKAMGKTKEENRQPTILIRLTEFRKELYEYVNSYMNISNKYYPPKEEFKKLSDLHATILYRLGSLENLIEESSGTANVDLKSTWMNALDVTTKENKKRDLMICIQATTLSIGKLEDDIKKGKRDPNTGEIIKYEQQREAEIDLANVIAIFDAMQLHTRVVKASKSLFADGYYAQAIFEAFKAVENFVKEKSGSILYGKQLMATVFNEDKPIIQVPEAGHFDKDVQEGFKFLFMGGTLGIRNPKAHQEVIQKDPFITLEYLGFASFLIKRIDYWEAGST